jgi:hypothetical protein
MMVAVLQDTLQREVSTSSTWDGGCLSLASTILCGARRDLALESGCRIQSGIRRGHFSLPNYATDTRKRHKTEVDDLLTALPAS